MGKIFCLMGKSSSGKDTIYRQLLQQKNFPLSPIVPCTTRPRREGEIPGTDYHFFTTRELQALQDEGRILELRSYQTVCGIWHYFTADFSIDLNQCDYLMIGTLEAYRNLQKHFGSDHIIPLYLQVDDGVRLQRALDRERKQAEPKYAELCRRFLADEKDFSAEQLQQNHITRIFSNEILLDTANEIDAYIRSQLSI